MSHALQEWKVLPHGKLTQVDENILTVVGQIHMPVGELPRRMTVVRLADGRLVIFSAIALDEDEMRQLEDWGTPEYLVVPNHLHRMDARMWKDRYPQLKVLAPEGSRKKVEEVVHVDASSVDFADPTVAFIAVPGTREHEAALEVSGPEGTTLVLNDIIGNIRDSSGFAGWMLRLMGFAGDEPHIPRPVKARIVDDKVALREQLERWSKIESLKHILVSHGDSIDDDPRGALRTLAKSLH